MFALVDALGVGVVGAKELGGHAGPLGALAGEDEDGVVLWGAVVGGEVGVVGVGEVAQCGDGVLA